MIREIDGKKYPRYRLWRERGAWHLAPLMRPGRLSSKPIRFKKHAQALRFLQGLCRVWFVQAQKGKP